MFSRLRRSLLPEKHSASGSWRTWKWYVGNYAFILPFMILFAVFIFWPILASLQMSFFRWEIFGPKPFIGFENYEELLTDDLWWVALRNTVYFAFLTSALLTVVPIFIAIALNTGIRGRNVFRTLYFFPYVLSASVVGIVAKWMLSQDFGAVNRLLASAGLGRVPFFRHSDLVIPSLSFITLWWAFGFPMLIYLAGLSNIPQDIYEAARIDGARGWQMIRYITIPLLRPIILFVAVTQLISHFQVFRAALRDHQRRARARFGHGHLLYVPRGLDVFPHGLCHRHGGVVGRHHHGLHLAAVPLWRKPSGILRSTK